MLLTKKSPAHQGESAQRTGSTRFVQSLSRGLSNALPIMDRRVFLRRSGLGVGVGLAASQLTLVKKSQAASAAAGDGSGKIEVKRTVCTHCSVGCAVDAVVQNGVWVRQEPVFDSPINLGAHCAKGAALRELKEQHLHLSYWETPYYASAIKKFVKSVVEVPGIVALDVGCGDGRFTELLLEWVAEKL